jgi:hypothetical protein
LGLKTLRRAGFARRRLCHFGTGTDLDNRSTKGQAGKPVGRATKTSATKPGGQDIKSVTQAKPAKPGWASGLRQLYDSVVDEPLPDSFSDLLSKLDDKN